MPVKIPESVMLEPVPLTVTVPGYRVNNHIPVSGNPFRTTLPVESEHVGAVIVPTMGAAGITGCAVITI
jgi:hypothetical protein